MHYLPDLARSQSHTIRHGPSREAGKTTASIFVEEGFTGSFLHHAISTAVLTLGGTGGVSGSIRKEEKKCPSRNSVETTPRQAKGKTAHPETDGGMLC